MRGTSIPTMAFILMVFLIGVAYYVGLTSDVAQVGTTTGNLINILTGRNTSGQFANYPSGATTGNTTTGTQVA